MPAFLSVETILDVHEDSIVRFSGDLGVRDLGLLESAVAQARRPSTSSLVPVDERVVLGDVEEVGRGHLEEVTVQVAGGPIASRLELLVEPPQE